MYLPLVTPETPSPDIYFQRILYLDLGRDYKGHLGLLFKVGGRSTSRPRPCPRPPGMDCGKQSSKADLSDTLSAFRRVCFHSVCEMVNSVRDEAGSRTLD